jgi:hypothetical protein
MTNLLHPFIIAATLLGVVYCLLLLWRNERVYRYRRQLIDQIHTLNAADVQAGKDYDGWRYRVFESVGYAEMMWQVWRPLDSFYPDRRFLQ